METRNTRRKHLERIHKRSRRQRIHNEVGYSIFQELAWMDKFGFSKITKEEFTEIAEKEKLISFNVNNYLKDKAWRNECGGPSAKFHNRKLYIEPTIRARGTDLFHAMKKKYQVEQQMKRDLKYWKSLQLIKKYNTKLHPIKELTAKEKLDEHITKHKGSKKRWPDRKKRKIWRSITAKNINWEYFYDTWLKARDQLRHLECSNTTIFKEIQRKHHNIRLMDDEQFVLWEAFYLQGINEVATYDQCANENVLNAIFTHYLLPECYHYEPFADYIKDDFQRLRCLWMMFG
jgi:hypothetical protein